MTTEPLDGITLEVWWSRLIAIADEAATTLLRTAFSTIIRESNDYRGPADPAPSPAARGKTH
jgi:N-methylhydantoinase B